MRLTTSTRHASGHSALRKPQSAFRQAFTLVELLVVITIIGILAGLLITAATRATRTARQTAIAVEIATIAQSIETYRNDVGGSSYPPDIGVGNTGVAAVRDGIVADFLRHFNRAFPRHREPAALLNALAGVNSSGSQSEEDNPNVPGGLNPAEALVFYLQRFSSDPQYPISGTGGPSFEVPTSAASLPEDLASRNWIGNFDPSRYGMLDGGVRQSVQQIYEAVDANNDGLFDSSELAESENLPRYVRYQDPRDNSTRQINLWQYFPPNSPQPLVYFDASRGIHDVAHPSLFSNVHAIKTLKSGATQSFVANIELANAGKFQILHCGIDEDWGEFGGLELNLALLSDNIDNAAQNATTVDDNPLLLFPNGPFTLELADTIVNFSDRATLEDNQP